MISVVRGLSGGVFAHAPDERMTARTAAQVLQARNVPLADVDSTRGQLEPLSRAEGGAVAAAAGDARHRGRDAERYRGPGVTAVSRAEDGTGSVATRRRVVLSRSCA